MVFRINTVIISKETRINVYGNKQEIESYKRKMAAIRGNEKKQGTLSLEVKAFMAMESRFNNKNY